MPENGDVREGVGDAAPEPTSSAVLNLTKLLGMMKGWWKEFEEPPLLWPWKRFSNFQGGSKL